MGRHQTIITQIRAAKATENFNPIMIRSILGFGADKWGVNLAEFFIKNRPFEI